jgi:MFS family permease
VAWKGGARLAPLKVPRFRALWLGGLFSWYGDFLTIPALLIIAYKLGGEFAVGLLFVFQTGPLLALLPLGGQLGDRGDRRRRLVSLDLARAALAALTIAGAQSHLLVILFLAVGASRSASALYDPGRRRLVTVVLPEPMVPAGSSLLSVVSESALVVAPALGAVLLLFVPPTMLIAADGATFLVSAALMARLGHQPAVWVRRAFTRQPAWLSLRHGFHLLFFDPSTRLFSVQALLGAALSSVIQVYFVPLARYTFGVGTNQVGIMYIVVGASSVLGSVVAIRRPQVRRRGLALVGYIPLVTATGVGLALGNIIVVAALVVFSASYALQEVWGFNRIQTTVAREGVGQTMGSALWCVYLGRAVGAALATWGTVHLNRGVFLGLLTLCSLAVCLVITLAGPMIWRRKPTTWPPGGPPLPF